MLMTLAGGSCGSRAGRRCNSGLEKATDNIVLKMMCEAVNNRTSADYAVVIGPEDYYSTRSRSSWARDFVIGLEALRVACIVRDPCFQPRE